MKFLDSPKKYLFICLLVNISEFLVDSFATIYLLEKGVSYQQIGVMWTIYLGISALTDYPTGGLADKFGRKKIYSVGALLSALSYFLILSDKIFILYISYAIKGFGLSFSSGALISWLSCELNDKSKFKNTLSQTRLFTSIASFILPIIFVTFKKVNLNNIFIISASIYIFVGLYVIFFLKENYGSQKKVFTIYKEVIKYCVHNKVLIFLIGVNIALYLFFTIFFYSWQPIAKKIIFNNKYLPIFYGIYTLINGWSAYLVKFIDEHNWKRFSLLVLLCYFLCFTSFYLANKLTSLALVIIAMVLFGISNGIIFMLNSIYINSHAPNEYKSSIFSFISGICTVVNVALQFILGRMIDLYGLGSILLFGCITSSILILSLIIIRKDIDDTSEVKSV